MFKSPYIPKQYGNVSKWKDISGLWVAVIYLMIIILLYLCIIIRHQDRLLTELYEIHLNIPKPEISNMWNAHYEYRTWITTRPVKKVKAWGPVNTGGGNATLRYRKKRKVR